MTADEVAEIERNKSDGGPDEKVIVDPVPVKAGTKRKSEGTSGNPSKKAKQDTETPEDDEDDDAEDDS